MDKLYYTTGNYFDYLTRYPRYQSIARDMMKLIPDIGPVLDFGCGVGFLTKAFHELNVEADGYDISEWAIDYGSKDLGIKNLRHRFVPAVYRTVFMLDVLEHIRITEIHKILAALECKYLIVRIPVPITTGEDFHLEISRNDEAHITCLDKYVWNCILERHGFYIRRLLNYEHIWNSDGVFCALYQKGPW